MRLERAGAPVNGEVNTTYCSERLSSLNAKTTSVSTGRFIEGAGT